MLSGISIWASDFEKGDDHEESHFCRVGIAHDMFCLCSAVPRVAGSQPSSLLRTTVVATIFGS
jgi:hypothetical protein